ncbi:acyl-CoA 6-desaturase-like [Ruditapes philippinarum]|uniref:acyl-CoA 6-desaturase-like n=1 Tax=Ruditapes philippinarum TaxID=129788 RepID=UPI00295A7003|nr:acyl-CoA 6-desaturase-like [Ruditapes philippinarum]XP_060566806.1 acyl-CoA 6-desaturase-like [Ruditapes philippinarum]
MGRGGQGSQKPKLPWSEIERHNSRDDRWIVIGGEVYDVTSWSYKHPGGSRLIGHYAGQDATEAVGAFHNNETQVNKYLKSMHIGTVENNVELDIATDFRKLKEVAKSMGLYEPSYTFYAAILGHIVLLIVLAYFVLQWFGVTWWSVALSLILFSTAQAQAAWTQHDYGHLSVFKNSKIDHFFHHLTMGCIKGASAHWWNHMHYQHHAKPNIIDKDPDVRIDKLFVVGEVMPVEVAKTRKKSMPFNWQHRYFFALGPPLLFPVYFQSMLFRHLFTRKLWMELSIAVTAMACFFYFFIPMLGVAGSIGFFFAVRCIESHWFTWVAQSNHLPMHIKNDEANPWLKLQIHATCDIEKSFFNDWFTGHLNFQIEHHLFPTMPRHNLYKIAPLVRSLCEKHGVPYTVKSLWQSFVDIVRALKSSGELWEETYREFHSD